MKAGTMGRSPKCLISIQSHVKCKRGGTHHAVLILSSTVSKSHMFLTLWGAVLQTVSKVLDESTAALDANMLT